MTITSLCVPAWKNRPKCITTRIWCPLWCLEFGDHIGMFLLTQSYRGRVTRTGEMKENCIRLPPHPPKNSFLSLLVFDFIHLFFFAHGYFTGTVSSSCWKKYVLYLKNQIRVDYFPQGFMKCLGLLNVAPHSWAPPVRISTHTKNGNRAGQLTCRLLPSQASVVCPVQLLRVCILGVRIYVCENSFSWESPSHNREATNEWTESNSIVEDQELPSDNSIWKFYLRTTLRKNSKKAA